MRDASFLRSPLAAMIITAALIGVPAVPGALSGLTGTGTGGAALAQTPGVPAAPAPEGTPPPAPQVEAPATPGTASPLPGGAPAIPQDSAPMLPQGEAPAAAGPAATPQDGTPADAGSGTPASGTPGSGTPAPSGSGTPAASGTATPPDGSGPGTPSVPANPGPTGSVAPAGDAAPAAPSAAPGLPVTEEIVEMGVDPATLPHDLSPLGMFRAADVVVKAVMIGLAFASLITWTIFIAKTLEYAAAMRGLRRSLRVILRADGLADAVQALDGRRDAAAAMVDGTAIEVERSAPTLDQGGAAGLKERVASLLSRTEAAAVRRLNRGTGLLATIGSTAPFVGLFGTVWGIMNSFIGISESQTTNLAVVAPGIAEALLATAIGLVAAIPAVVIYNLFARAIGLYRAGLGDAAAGVERLVSRDIDFHAYSPRAAARPGREG